MNSKVLCRALCFTMGSLLFLPAAFASPLEMAKISCGFSSDDKKIMQIQDWMLKPLSLLHLENCGEGDLIKPFTQRCGGYDFSELGELMERFNRCENSKSPTCSAPYLETFRTSCGKQNITQLNKEYTAVQRCVFVERLLTPEQTKLIANEWVFIYRKNLKRWNLAYREKCASGGTHCSTDVEIEYDTYDKKPVKGVKFRNSPENGGNYSEICCAPFKILKNGSGERCPSTSSGEPDAVGLPKEGKAPTAAGATQ